MARPMLENKKPTPVQTARISAVFAKFPKEKRSLPRKRNSREGFAFAVRRLGMMMISTFGAGSLSRAISVSRVRRPGLLPSTILVMPLTRAYSAMAVAGSLP